MQAVAALNPISDEENDENLDLDLHVSDTEDNTDQNDTVDEATDLLDALRSSSQETDEEAPIKLCNGSIQSEITENATEKLSQGISEEPQKNGVSNGINNEPQEEGVGKVIQTKEVNKEIGVNGEHNKIEVNEKPEVTDTEINEGLKKHQANKESCDNEKLHALDETCQDKKEESRQENEVDNCNENASNTSENEDTLNENNTENNEETLGNHNEKKEKIGVDKEQKVEVKEVKMNNVKEKVNERNIKVKDDDKIGEDDDMELEEETDGKLEETVIPVNKSSTEKNTSSESSDKDENEDLLLVMEEKTTEADETENLSQEDESNEETGENTENNTIETNQEDDAMDIEENNVDDQIDIEESDVNKKSNNSAEDDMEVDDSNEELNNTVIENKREDDGEENKENEEQNKKVDLKVEVDKKSFKTDIKEETEETACSVLRSILNNRKNNLMKSLKRQLNDLEEKKDIKKIKIEEKPKSVTPLKKLEAFKQFMLDKSMKSITRDQLEMLCIQKMCETIVQRSEIGELKLKIKTQEQMIDCLRKETVLLSKQTRDLHIVHQKVAQDIAKVKDKFDKPLIVPKITRSVGLQAVVRDELRRRLVKSPVTVKQPQFKKIQPIVPSTSNAEKAPTPIITRTYPSPTKTVPQHTPLRVITTTAKSKAQTPTSVTTVTPKPPEVSKGIIDLTDEDDRVIATPSTSTSKQTNGKVNNVGSPNGTKVNMINAPNGHKFVVMPNGQTVMVKIAPPAMVSGNQQVRPTQTPANGMVRTVGQVRPIRAMTRPTAIRAKTVSVPTPQTPRTPTLRHPAPLPNAPPPNPSVSSLKLTPPKPQLMLNKTTCGTGIILSWKMPYKLDMFEDIASYQLYAYQETKSQPKTDSWGKIGDVKALELPMAVTLTQFAVGNRYYFAVRAVDILSRYGPFSDYQTILL